MARQSLAAVGYRSLGKPKPARTIALIWNKRRQLSRAALELRGFIEKAFGGR